MGQVSENMRKTGLPFGAIAEAAGTVAKRRETASRLFPNHMAF